MSPGRGDHRFPRSKRIRSRRDYLALSQSGARVAGKHFVLLNRPGNLGRPARLGITASRRVGNAVARNLVKRRVREWFRQRSNAVETDWIMIARPGVAALSHQDTLRALEGVARRAEQAKNSV